jgi:branched-chain amino acid transport system substrate-binding protein
MDLTGQGAAYGKMMARGMQLAVDQINAAGGIGGKIKVNLVVDDDQGQAGLAVSQMRSLVSKNNALAIATMYSAPPLAQQSVGETLQIPVFNGAGDDPTLTGHEWLYNSVLTGDQVVGGVLKYLYDNKNVRKVGGLIGTSFSAEGIERFQALWKQVSGSDFTTFLSVDPDSLTDASPQLRAIMATNPDAILVELDGVALETAFKDLARLGYEGLLLSGPQIQNSKEPLTGPLAGQVFFGTTPWSGPPADLVSAWQAMYPGEEPSYYGANYFSLTMIIKQALEYAIDQGWDVSGASLKKALDADLTFTEGCCGPFKYNALHAAAANVEIDSVSNGTPSKVTEVPAP